MKPTPVINFLSWIYLLIGMENFFWTVFRFVYEGRHGQLTRTVLNGILAACFIGFAVYLSKSRATERETEPRPHASPVPWAWVLSVVCCAIQYYRFQIWSESNVNNLGISDALSRYFTVVHMHDTWFAMMASLVLAQEYRRLTDTLRETARVLHWEMTAGTFRPKGWLKKSLYLELTEARLVIRTNLFGLRRVPVRDIIEVRDAPMFLYPPLGLRVRYKDPKRKRERQVNFLSEDYGAWLSAFEQVKVPVKDEAGMRERRYHLYRWWRFYTVAKAAVRAFVVVTVVITLAAGLLGPVLNKDYDDFAYRNEIAARGGPGPSRYKPLTPGYAKTLQLRKVEADEEKVTLWVEHALRRYPREIPAYFNHLFRDTKIVLYRNRDYKDIRFRSNDKLTESPELAHAGFLYAFPVVRDKQGSYRYRFVYLKKIDAAAAYLISVETTYHQGEDKAYWRNMAGYRVEGEYAGREP